MILYKDVTKGLLGRLDVYEVYHVPRLENKEVDIFSRLVLGNIPDHIA